MQNLLKQPKRNEDREVEEGETDSKHNGNGKRNQEKSQKKSRIQNLHKKQGSLSANRDEILKICSDFYQELYNLQTETKIYRQRLRAKK